MAARRGLAAGILATAWAGRPAVAGSGEVALESPVSTEAPLGTETVPGALPVTPAGRTAAPRLSSLAGLAFGFRGKRSAGSDGWGPAWAVLALILAAGGGLAAAARRFRPGPATGAVQVVGRVSLSPKHSVYVLRVGRRMLLVGAGTQGPPALITELDDLPEIPPGDRRGEQP
jgi:hypothetical protein